MEEYIVFAFDSTHEAIKSEKLLEEKNVNGRLIPLPPEVSAGCGLALRINKEIKDEVISLLTNNDVSIGKMYSLIKENGKRIVNKID